MLVEFTDEQELFRSTVRDFCDREISREYVRECDREHRAPVELYERLGQQGWLGINIPEEYDGAGGGAVEVAILLEELGRSFLDRAFWVFRTVTWGALPSAATAPTNRREISFRPSPRARSKCASR